MSAVYTPAMTDNTRWIVLAILGAVFAALVQVTSKPALEELDSATVNLLRVPVMLLFFGGIILWEAFISRSRELVGSFDTGVKSAVAWALVSGVATSLSWFFGYKALKLAGVSKSYPIDKLSVVIGVGLAVLLFGERPSGWNWTGIGLMIVGAALVTIPKDQTPAWLLGGR